MLCWPQCKSYVSGNKSDVVVVMNYTQRPTFHKKQSMWTLALTLLCGNHAPDCASCTPAAANLPPPVLHGAMCPVQLAEAQQQLEQAEQLVQELQKQVGAASAAGETEAHQIGLQQQLAVAEEECRVNRSKVRVLRGLVPFSFDKRCVTVVTSGCAGDYFQHGATNPQTSWEWCRVLVEPQQLPSQCLQAGMKVSFAT